MPTLRQHLSPDDAAYLLALQRTAQERQSRRLADEARRRCLGCRHPLDCPTCVVARGHGRDAARGWR